MTHGVGSCAAVLENVVILYLLMLNIVNESQKVLWVRSRPIGSVLQGALLKHFLSRLRRSEMLSYEAEDVAVVTEMRFRQDVSQLSHY
jgi:hypothetical protein